MQNYSVTWVIGSEKKMAAIRMDFDILNHNVKFYEKKTFSVAKFLACCLQNA